MGLSLTMIVLNKQQHVTLISMLAKAESEATSS